MQHQRSILPLIVLGVLLSGLLSACDGNAAPEPERKVLRVPLRARIGNLDPVRGGTQYSSLASSPIFERLVDYRYPRRPFQLRPALAIALPEVSADGRVYSFELRPGVRFQDDPAFRSTGGRGPELTTDDVFYSIRRMCDAHWGPTGYWLFEGRIEGLDRYKAEEAERRARHAAEGRLDRFRFDYDRPIEGLRKIDDRRFEIVLTQPFPQLLYVLAMPYASIVPREAVEHYDLEFGNRPVGTGPYRVREFRRGSWLILERNPTWHGESFPTDLDSTELALGMGDYAGRDLPFIDRIVLEIFEQDQPMWLKFRRGDLDLTQVPSEYWPTVFRKDATARPELEEKGIRAHPLPLLDLIYWGFNMEDPVWGQPPEMKLVRRAIGYAVDLEARNHAFYNGRNTLYQGPIPPGLEGFVPGHRARDLDAARALMARAGHPVPMLPEGSAGMVESLPPLRYETSRGSNSQEQAQMLKRQLAEIGIRLEASFNSFPELNDKLKKRKAQFFGLAWGADYPDAENFLQLFYGPNASPGSNNFNFADAEYDSLFEAAKTMLPSPERTQIYTRLREIVIDQAPMIGSMARTRNYLVQRRLRNFRPEEVYSSWWQYLDVVDGES